MFYSEAVMLAANDILVIESLIVLSQDQLQSVFVCFGHGEFGYVIRDRES